MATKTNYLLGLLDGAIAQIDNRGTQNRALATLREIRDQVAARKLLGEDPDESKLAEKYAAVAAAVAEVNAIEVTIRSEEDVAQGLAESQTEEEAEAAMREAAKAATAEAEAAKEAAPVNKEMEGDTEE